LERFRPQIGYFFRAMTYEHQDRLHKILEVLREAPTRNLVADVGCFDGSWSVLFRDLGGAVTVEGFDVVDEALVEARSKGIKAYRWDFNAETCPAEDDRYDVVIAGEVVEHVFDTDTFMGELYRILRPEGVLILSTPNLNYWWNRMLVMLGKMPYFHPGVSQLVQSDPRVFRDHIRMGNVAEWRALLTACGFRVEKTLPTIRRLPGRGLRTRILSGIERTLSRFPTLSSSVIYVARVPRDKES